MATMRFKMDEFERRINDESTSIKGCEFEIEFELTELPDIIKEVPVIVSSISSATEKANSRELEKVCDEVNEARRNLAETEIARDSFLARAEAAERRAERLKAEKEELKEKLNGNQ